MKRQLLCFLLLGLFIPALGQVTRLSNNTSYEWGFPLTNSKLILRSQISNTLWVYDIPGNTFTQLSSTMTVASNASFGFFNGKFYFAGTTVAEGIELWVTDGTPAGTLLVKDINPGGDSNPNYGFIVYNNELYFTAADGTTGRELWKTDGSGGGTVQVKDINTGPANGFSNNPVSQFMVVNGLLVFSATSAADGDELWATDGTNLGTTEIKNIEPTPGVGSHISSFTSYNSKLIFTAFDLANGDRLWITDGTSGGTALIKDINPNPPAAPPLLYFMPDIAPYFFNFQNTLYFTANDGTDGAELWKTDGTTGGTTLVKDINPGSADGFPMGLPAMVFAVKNSTKFFFTATTATEGAELWQSDGTGTGTTLLADIETGVNSSDPIILPNFFGGGGLFQGNKFFFIAKTIAVEGQELYISDGTPGGTSIVKDINPGPPDGFDQTYLSFFYGSSKFYFVGNDGINGNELWETDGTDPGTDMVENINAIGTPPNDGSNISQMMAASNTLFFFGTDGDDATNTDFFKLDASLGVLPLRWVSMKAVPANNDVNVSWETAEEESTDHFIVQRSTDGINFQEIGNVRAKGVGSNSYSFTDHGAMRAGAVKKWYYRVRDVDIDGRSALSRTATVALNKMIASVLIAPNPVVNELKLIIQSVSNDQAMFNVVNMDGKLVLQKSISIRRGENTISENVAALPNGAYILQLTSPDGTAYIERFMVQHQ